MSEVVYCGQCGQSNPEENKFCEKCGKPLSIKKSFPKTSLKTAPENSCPKCKGAGQIRKLSSIVSGDTHLTSGESYSSGRANVYDKDSNFIGDSHSSSSGYINITGKSELAKKVSSPPMPPKPPEPKGGSSAANFIGGSFAIVALCLGFYVLSSLRENGASMLLALGGCAGSMILTTVIGTIIAIAITEPSKEQKLAHQEQLKIHEQHLEKWHHACRRWEQMYYCYQDDVVFVPGENEAVQPNNTIPFCYKNIKE